MGLASAHLGYGSSRDLECVFPHGEGILMRRAMGRFSYSRRNFTPMERPRMSARDTFLSMAMLRI